MRRLVVPLGLYLTICVLPAEAKSPADIADLVGARAAGAESDMQSRGYADVGGNNTWWNAGTGVCAKVHVSQGRYARIDSLTPSACGQKKGAASGACPADVSQADRYKYPACK